ncbi:MAG TPA: hypothetical protein VG496_01400, partial [Myxococcales bacterium]|nr:hypothetical protein [Myxococcales bacterium]
MHRRALAITVLAVAGCVRETRPPEELPPPVATQPPPTAQPPVFESVPPPVPDRTRQVLEQVQQQQRWTRDALAARPPADELRDVRSGDAEAISDTRKRFRRLVTAIERTTWIRETVPGVVRSASDPEPLIAAFNEAARDRNEAFAAAEATARALAESRSGNAISLDELRHALQNTHRARQSEQKLAAKLGRSPASQANAAIDPLQRLRTVPMPPEPPFIAAAAHFVAAHPAEDRALDSWPPQLAQEKAQVRAAVAQLKSPEPAGMAAVTGEGDELDEEAGGGQKVAA